MQGQEVRIKDRLHRDKVPEEGVIMSKPLYDPAKESLEKTKVSGPVKETGHTSKYH